MFFRKIFSGQSKDSLADFLVNHSRYYTINSSHGMSSYSNTCKLPTLGLRGAQYEKARQVIKIKELHELISAPILDFIGETDGAYTVAFTGRSGGHMVLYAGEFFTPRHQSRCTCCGTPSHQSVASGSLVQCGLCSGALTACTPTRQHRALSMGIDDFMARQDFMELPMSDLKDKVELVRTFDRVCDQVRDEFIEVLNDYIVVEEIVMHPSTVMRLERV